MILTMIPQEEPARVIAERAASMILLEEKGAKEMMILMTILDLEAEREVNLMLPRMEEEAANKVATGKAVNMIQTVIPQEEGVAKEMVLVTIQDLAAEREVKMTLAEKAAMVTKILMVLEKVANMIIMLDLDQEKEAAVTMIQMEAEKEANPQMEEEGLCL